MKCPKCHYLGFETGDRCRNCGYDFSLVPSGDAAMPNLTLREPEPAAAEAPPLPLFARGGAADDEPMIKMPAAPRAPLAVRRTPEIPRPRTVAKPVRRAEYEPVLQFADETVPEDDENDVIRPVVTEPAAPAASGGFVARRVLAAAIDLAILFGIDAVVIYFTLRMAALGMEDWRMLPPVPMLSFLAILKLSYFCAFTSVGGQTIGKMAARIQVVADDDESIDPVRAGWRVLAGALSMITFGLAFIPALIGPDRRALHDRVARTHVVARPS